MERPMERPLIVVPVFLLAVAAPVIASAGDVEINIYTTGSVGHHT